MHDLIATSSRDSVSGAQNHQGSRAQSWLWSTNAGVPTESATCADSDVVQRSHAEEAPSWTATLEAGDHSVVAVGVTTHPWQ